MNHSYSIVFAIAIAFTSGAYAATPQAIDYQGRLTDGSGNPVADSSYTVTFTIYDKAAGGNSKWTETQGVTTLDGLFAVLLGTINAIDDSVFSDATRYLGVQVGIDPEITPRTMLVTVPWSFRVGSVDGADGGQITGDVEILGTATIGLDHTNSGTGAFVAGNSNIVSGFEATITGGNDNEASAYATVIGGGESNQADEEFAIVGGGIANAAVGPNAIVDGGELNIASGNHSVVGGGFNNGAEASYAVVAGGHSNTAADTAGTVGGGSHNYARGIYSVVAGGGAANAADSNSASGKQSSIGGGRRNVASGLLASIGGGRANTSSGTEATVGGGSDNRAVASQASVSGGSGNVAEAQNTTVGGGKDNTASVIGATIGGGRANTAIGVDATISGGQDNIASAPSASVGGGIANTASGTRSTVPGGFLNTAAGWQCFAAGYNAKANHDGSFVLVANSSTVFSDSVRSGGDEQMVLRSDGGLYITNTPELCPYDNTKLITTRGGAYLSGNGNSWTNASDRNLKENFTPVDGADILDRLAELPISQWNYLTEDETVRHVGPVAQDFYRVFGLGNDDKSISTVDPSGVALAAIKELHRENQQLKKLIGQMEERLTQVENR